MEYTINGTRDDLLASLEPASRFVTKTSTNKSVQNVRLLVEGGVGKLEAWNGITAIRQHFWGTTDPLDLDIHLSPRLVGVLKAMRPGDVTMTKKETSGLLELKGPGKGKYEVPIYDAPWSGSSVDDSSIDWDDVPAVDAKEILDALAFASAFASKSDQRINLMGVNVKVVEDEYVMSSSDTYRFYQHRMPLPPGGNIFGDEEITVPTTLIANLKALFTSGSLKLASTDNAVLATDAQGERVLSMRKVDGQFPDINKLMESIKFEHEVEIDSVEARDVLARVSAVGDGKAPVEITFGKDEAHVKITNDDSSKAEDFIPLLASDCDVLRMGFNRQMFAAGLGIFQGNPKVKIANPQRPILFVSDIEPKQYLLMPVRLA